MVIRVADDEAALAHERRDGQAVGGKAHAGHHGCLLAHVARHQGLQVLQGRGGPWVGGGGVLGGLGFAHVARHQGLQGRPTFSGSNRCPSLLLLH